MEITGNISVSVLQFVLLQDVGADTLFSFPFSAYFPRAKEEPDLAKEKPAEQTKVWLLPIEKITPSPFQARTVFDEGEIKKLAVSILQNGLLQPISVRRMGAYYELIAGERRLRASKMAGYSTIPAIVFDQDDQESALIALVENIQRQDLNFFEEALTVSDIFSMIRFCKCPDKFHMLFSLQ